VTVEKVTGKKREIPVGGPWPGSAGKVGGPGTRGQPQP
jgi:hypothetical protein